MLCEFVGFFACPHKVSVGNAEILQESVNHDVDKIFVLQVYVDVLDGRVLVSFVTFVVKQSSARPSVAWAKH